MPFCVSCGMRFSGAGHYCAVYNRYYFSSQRNSASPRASPFQEPLSSSPDGKPRRDEVWKALLELNGIWIRETLMQISDTQPRVAREIIQKWQSDKKKRSADAIAPDEEHRRRQPWRYAADQSRRSSQASSRLDLDSQSDLVSSAIGAGSASTSYHAVAENQVNPDRSLPASSRHAELHKSRQLNEHCSPALLRQDSTSAFQPLNSLAEAGTCQPSAVGNTSTVAQHGAYIETSTTKFRPGQPLHQSPRGCSPSILDKQDTGIIHQPLGDHPDQQARDPSSSNPTRNQKNSHIDGQSDNRQPEYHHHQYGTSNDRLFQDWLLRKVKRATPAEQIAKAPEVFQEIGVTIEHLRELACSSTASFDIKMQTLESLMFIGRLICTFGGSLFIELRKMLGINDCLTHAMVIILMEMDLDDMKKLANFERSGVAFHKRLSWLRDLGCKHGLFTELSTVVETLTIPDTAAGADAEATPELDAPGLTPKAWTSPSSGRDHSILEQPVSPRSASNTLPPQGHGSDYISSSPTVLHQPLARPFPSPNQSIRSFGSRIFVPMDTLYRIPGYLASPEQSGNSGDPCFPPSPSYPTPSNNTLFSHQSASRPSNSSREQPQPRPSAAVFLPTL